MTRIVSIAFVALFLAAALSACGKKTGLIPPDGSTFPRQYPKQ